MRSIYILILTFGLLKLRGQCALIITGVLDGPLPGGFPKVVELYALEDILDLNNYGLGAANNGNGSDGIEFTFPLDTLYAGTFIYVSAESSSFLDFFGFPPDYTTGTLPNSACYFNGDDAIELYHNETLIDLLGDSNQDGTGTPWDYQDGWLYRSNNNICNYGSFNTNNWISSGVGALAGEANNSNANNPFPLQSYQTNPLPIHDIHVECQTKGQIVDLEIVLIGTLEEELIQLERSVSGKDFESFNIIKPLNQYLKLSTNSLVGYNFVKIKLLDSNGFAQIEQIKNINWPKQNNIIAFTQNDEMVLRNLSQNHLTAEVYLSNSQTLKQVHLKPGQTKYLSFPLRKHVYTLVFKDQYGRLVYTKKLLL